MESEWGCGAICNALSVAFLALLRVNDDETGSISHMSLPPEEEEGTVTSRLLVSGTRKKNCHMSLSFFFFLFFFNQFQTPRPCQPHRGSQVF